MMFPYSPSTFLMLTCFATTQISNTRQILTSPSLLESTSLIFAFGPRDLFSTRSSPSATFDVLSEDFNKVRSFLFSVMRIGAADAQTLSM